MLIVAEFVCDSPLIWKDKAPISQLDQLEFPVLPSCDGQWEYSHIAIVSKDPTAMHTLTSLLDEEYKGEISIAQPLHRICKDHDLDFTRNDAVWDQLNLQPCLNVVVVIDHSTKTPNTLQRLVSSVITAMEIIGKSVKDLILVYVPPSSGGQWCYRTLIQLPYMKRILLEARLMEWHRPVDSINQRPDKFTGMIGMWPPTYRRTGRIAMYTRVMLRTMAEIISKGEFMPPPSSLRGSLWSDVDSVVDVSMLDKNGDEVSEQKRKASRAELQALRTSITPLLDPTDQNALWYYKDLSNKVQGPFSLDVMWRWAEDGHFNIGTLQVSCGSAEGPYTLWSEAAAMEKIVMKECRHATNSTTSEPDDQRVSWEDLYHSHGRVSEKTDNVVVKASADRHTGTAIPLQPMGSGTSETRDLAPASVPPGMGLDEKIAEIPPRATTQPGTAQAPGSQVWNFLFDGCSSCNAPDQTHLDRAGRSRLNALS